MPFLYSAMKLFAWYSGNLFFRDITVINKENIPNEGPTIIYGNHNNQFVDGMLLIDAVSRPINFIAAAASIRRPLVGSMIKATGAIPVERPQDIKQQKGQGTLVDFTAKRLTGRNTRFTKLTQGTTLHVQGLPEIKIKAIVNDTELQVEGEIPEMHDVNLPYKFLLKLDFSELYSQVWKQLNDGKCVGIFPEGGSHDRMGLLPLKAGICIMALGAMERYGVPVKLVPCGFNYYNPQKFRSKAILQFGPAYEIPKQMVELYRKDKKKAIAILLQNIQRMLKAVTIEFNKYEELYGLFLCRQLYELSSKRIITTKEKLQLNRRFAKGYMLLRQNPKYAQQYKKLLNYSSHVQLSGIKLARQDYYGSRFVDFFKFIFYLQKCLLRSIIALPGFLMMGPTTTLIAYLAEKQRLKCLKGSKVKMYGNDVVGSYKIILSIFLMPLTCAVHSSILYFILNKYTKLTPKTILKLSFALFALQPVYALLFVKSYDSFKRSFLKLKSFFMRLFNPNIYDQFNREKKQMQKKILMMVEEEGKRVVQNFDQNRVLKKNQLHQSGTTLYIFDNEEQEIKE